MFQSYADITNPFENNNAFVGRVVRRNWRGKELWRRSMGTEHRTRSEALAEATRYAYHCAGVFESVKVTQYI